MTITIPIWLLWTVGVLVGCALVCLFILLWAMHCWQEGRS